MPHDTPAAQQGRVLAAVFEVEIGREGVIDDIRVFGNGWTIETVERPTMPIAAAAGVLRIPFRATPTDPEEPIGLTLTYNGRRVSRMVRLGPIARAESGRPRPTVRVEGPLAAVALQN
jgi:hypothetical protein